MLMQNIVKSLDLVLQKQRELENLIIDIQNQIQNQIQKETQNEITPTKHVLQTQPKSLFQSRSLHREHNEDNAVQNDYDSLDAISWSSDDDNETLIMGSTQFPGISVSPENENNAVFSKNLLGLFENDPAFPEIQKKNAEVSRKLNWIPPESHGLDNH